jgi:hypothetical protein
MNRRSLLAGVAAAAVAPIGPAALADAAHPDGNLLAAEREFCLGLIGVGEWCRAHVHDDIPDDLEAWERYHAACDVLFSTPPQTIEGAAAILRVWLNPEVNFGVYPDGGISNMADEYARDAIRNILVGLERFAGRPEMAGDTVTSA